MTDRGLPIVDGAPACPFVAFEDDRDERAASPDHRHRCYAEANPAPRALAHQEAYCLSSAFPVCPTFQDWARREAARSRADGPRRADPDTEAGQSQRNPPRNWAAPPPWLSRGDRRGEEDSDWEDDGGALDHDQRPEVPRRGRGLSGSYADRVASDPAAELPGGFPDDELGTLTSAEASGIAAAGASAAGAGAPGAGAERASRPEPAHLEPAASSGAGPAGTPAWDEGAEAAAAEAAAAPVRPRRRERDAARPLPGTVDERVAGAERRPERRREGPAPEWERSKPLEAYPTLRSRRLPELSVPPILVAVVALALAAAVLFALPGLLGFGNPPADASAAPSSAIATSLPSLAPTPVPQPTQLTYIVAAGDTMSRIAGRFDVSLEDLIAANSETVPDPDKLEIGQELIIPVPLPAELPAATEIPPAQ
ncbi:MAG TPA: LysM domain-containing protein [Candidatus Limnocylindria bacterium]|nr:LysM domain-containing protein [Candidatus Limnocylindria bacterium]